jgi:hypothetical protein
MRHKCSTSVYPSKELTAGHCGHSMAFQMGASIESKLSFWSNGSTEGISPIHFWLMALRGKVRPSQWLESPRKQFCHQKCSRLVPRPDCVSRRPLRTLDSHNPRKGMCLPVRLLILQVASSTFSSSCISHVYSPRRLVSLVLYIPGTFPSSEYYIRSLDIVCCKTLRRIHSYSLHTIKLHLPNNMHIISNTECPANSYKLNYLTKSFH